MNTMDIDCELIYTDISGISVPDGEMRRLSALIPAYFWERVQAANREEQKVERIAEGLLLADALERRGYEASAAQIAAGPHGKPELINIPGLYFNISHSAGLVLMVISQTEAGCDIQMIKSGGSIAARFFTAEENGLIDQAEEEEKDILFTRLWARKESYIKATGEGMMRDLRSFSVIEGVTPDGCIFVDRNLKGFAVCACFYDNDGTLRRCQSFPELRFMPFQNLCDVI